MRQVYKYTWRLQDNHTAYFLDWDIIKTLNTSRWDSGICNLCVGEKLEIFHLTNKVNKHTELISTSPHGIKPPNLSKKK